MWAINRLMKKIFFIVFVLNGIQSFSQDLIFYLESKGAIGIGGILNSSVEIKNQSIALIGNAGIGGNVVYDEKIGFSLDVLFGNHVAKYRGLQDQINPDQTYSSKISMLSTQIPLLLLLPNEGGYIALGPQLNIMQGITYSSSSSFGNNSNVNDYYRNANWSVVLELGRYNQFGRGPVSLITAARFNFGFSDIGGVNPEGIPYTFLPQKNRSTIYSASFVVGLLYQLRHI